MYEIEPMNRYVWIEPITQENKVGTLFIVSHSQNSYQLGRVKAFAECDECKGLTVGCIVLYDSLGQVSHRLGNQSLTTVKAANILGVVIETDPSEETRLPPAGVMRAAGVDFSKLESK